MRVGVLTGGGDCPGLNAVIRGIVRKGVPDYGYSFLGFRDGWRGPLEALTKPLDIPAVRGLLPRGGTILGSSRTNPFAISGGVEKIKRNLQNLGVDALIAIGGEDTLGVATKLYEMGVNVVGVPKTIDNDLSGTDYTFGFDTAVNIAMEAIDRLHTTAESHHRALIVEVMGRHAGWIALHSGMAGGANAILIPEVRFDIEQVCQWVEQRFQLDYAPIIVVAEGAKPKEGEESLLTGEKDAFGHVRLGGIGDWLAREIEARTGKEARTTVLGHVQRGGTPTARDRWLATRFGLHAIDAVHRETVGAHGRAARHRHRHGAAGGGDQGAQGRRPRAVRRGRGASSADARCGLRQGGDAPGPPGAQPAPAAQHPRPQQHQQQDPDRQQDRRDREREHRVEHRERRHPDHGDVLADAHGDVARGFGRGVDDQSQTALDQVRHQRGRAAGRGQDRLLQRGCVLRDEQADHRADRRADRRGDRIPQRVEVRDLVGHQLHDVQRGRDDQHVGAGETFGNARDFAEPPDEAEDEHHQVGVDPARPPAGQDDRQELHDPNVRMWRSRTGNENQTMPCRVAV